jgi:hypothetical protein
MRVGRCASVLMLAGAVGLAGCSGPTITEDTPTAVTVRYDGIVSRLADATALAERTCARHGKTARLRRTTNEKHYLAERFAHFECVAGRH